MNNNYISKLKEIQSFLLETEEEPGTVEKIGGFAKRMEDAFSSIDGFTNLFRSNDENNYKNIDVGTVEKCWNAAKDDKLGIGDRLLNIFKALSFQGKPIEGPKGQVRALKKEVSEFEKVTNALKGKLEDRQVGWSYIKAGTILIIIGLVLGIANNPNMFRSATKKAISTAKYVGQISASKNNLNVAARGFSHFYIRVMKFMDENQAFTMCFMAGLFLIGIGIWKRYY